MCCDSWVTEDLYAVHGSSELRIAVGRGGTVVSRESAASSWQVDREPSALDFHGLWVGPSGSAIAVGFSATFPSYTAEATPPAALGMPSLEFVGTDGRVRVEWEGQGEGVPRPEV